MIYNLVYVGVINAVCDEYWQNGIQYTIGESAAVATTRSEPGDRDPTVGESVGKGLVGARDVISNDVLPIVTPTQTDAFVVVATKRFSATIQGFDE
jgi:hypothetical protein